MAIGVTPAEVLERTTVETDTENLTTQRVESWISFAESTVLVELGQSGIVIEDELSNIEEGKRNAIKELVILNTLGKLYHYLNDTTGIENSLSLYQTEIAKIKNDPNIINMEGADQGNTASIGRLLTIYEDDYFYNGRRGNTRRVGT